MRGKIWRKSLGILLLILFISYQGANTIFMHTHQEGKNLIMHSHPYGKNTPHTHLLGDFFLIHTLTFIAIYYDTPWFKSNIQNLISELLRPQHQIGHPILKKLYTIGFRAPPSNH